jgi:Leucine-rich repeat (LRR) protein
MSPQPTFDKYSKEFHDKSLLIRELITIIENSINVYDRIDGLKKINQITVNFESNNLEKEDFFKFFENLLISDSNDKIRNEAAIFLSHNYTYKALEPLRWAIHHETSPVTLLTIFKSLMLILEKMEFENSSISKTILISILHQMEDKDFKAGFENLIQTKKIHDIKFSELSQILRNYFALIFLKKRYWRVKYEVQNFRLIDLDFIFKGLSTLPDVLKYLTSLKVLTLRYNQLVTLPEWLGDLNSLEYLNLNVNNLNELPQSIGSLLNLKELSLWKNELQTLPDSIGFLTALTKLNLRLNHIEVLPTSLGNLTKLTELNLHDNNLKELPRTIINLESLESLNLSWNSLLELPQSIGNLKSLKSLDLERNELLYVPHSIGFLSSLEFLNLGENKLQNIPESISNLQNLKFLNLSRNKLEKFPEVIINCSKLEEIYLGDNNISNVSKYEQILKDKRVNVHI